MTTQRSPNGRDETGRSYRLGLTIVPDGVERVGPSSIVATVSNDTTCGACGKVFKITIQANISENGVTTMTAIDIADNRLGDRQADDQIRSLFAEDGTIYLVTGYFTESGYRELRPDIVDFLERSRENRLVIVVSPSADQFSPAIVSDVERLDSEDQVSLLSYPDGCLHAKLYLRTGEQPAAIVGSANLTRVGFEQNLELSVKFEGDALDGEALDAYVEWVDRLVAASRPIRRWDVLRVRMIATSLGIWFNKARLLPTRALLRQPAVYILLSMMVLYVLMD